MSSKVLAAAFIAGLVSLGGGAQAQTVSPMAAVGGLEPKFADVKGVKTRYYDVGQGEPLLLVHGGGFASSNGNSANMWSKNIPGLSKRFRVFAVDKLAAGMTDNPPNDSQYNLQGEVEHMSQFIRTMRLGPVHLVGQSRGAGLAWMLAMKHPGLVKTLVLVDSGTASPVVGVPKHETLMKQCPEDLAERMKCEMRILSFEPNFPSTWDEAYYAAAMRMVNLPKSRAAREKMAAGAGEPLRSEWEEWKKRLHERLRAQPVLPMPLLLYWGTNDPQAPADKEGLAFYDVLASHHPKVRMIIVNKAGHFHFREYPDEFNHNVMSFIDYWNRQPPTKPAMHNAGSRTVSQSVSKTGAIAGLEPKFVDVQGVQTRYYDEGRGEPVVLVHGGGLAAFNGNSGNMWSKNIPGFSKRFRVLAVDKLAAGMTGNPPNDDDYNLEGEVEHMYQFIRTMRLGPVHLVGQSRGAGLAWVLAMKYPDAVKTLVLVNSQTAAPEIAPSTRGSMMEPCEKGDFDWRMRCEMEVLSFAPNIPATWDADYYAAGAYMGGLPKAKEARAKMAAGAGEARRAGWNKEKEGLHERMKAGPVLPMPVLMHWGYNDPQATVERAMTLYGNLAIHHPKVRLFWINKAGHFHFREYPDEFNHNVMSFIDYWSRQPAATTSSR